MVVHLDLSAHACVDEICGQYEAPSCVRRYCIGPLEAFLDTTGLEKRPWLVNYRSAIGTRLGINHATLHADCKPQHESFSGAL